MPPKKTPYRLGYKFEYKYPAKGAVLLPSHGSGPRCKVEYDPNSDGPWTTLQIMRIDGDDVEIYGCVIPRYYAIPLILINKQLAFYEAQCRPDGTPLPPSSSCGIKQRDMREYTYLLHLRSRFLQAVFEMNHERVLSERWQYGRIHGFLHRMYRRFGHDTYQRIAYWREEINQGRVPYTVPDIAEMDWKAYLLEDVETSTRLNAFLWNQVSQGYSRVVKDEPPFESWRAWRAGRRDHKPEPYLTPVSSPARELPPSELDDVSAAAVADAGQATAQGSGSNCGVGGYDNADVRAALTAAPPMQAAAVAATAAGAESASGPRRGVEFGAAAVVSGNRDGREEVEEDSELAYDENGRVKVVTTDLTSTPNSRGWAIPSPPSSSSGSSLQQSQSTSSGLGRSMSSYTSTSGQERYRQDQVSFKYNAPEDVELSLIRCTFTKRREDAKNFKTRLEFALEEDVF